MNYEGYLVHFNPNHDPETGRFSKNRSGISAKKEMKKAKRFKKLWSRGTKPQNCIMPQHQLLKT